MWLDSVFNLQHSPKTLLPLSNLNISNKPSFCRPQPPWLQSQMKITFTINKKWTKLKLLPLWAKPLALHFPSLRSPYSHIKNPLSNWKKVGAVNRLISIFELKSCSSDLRMLKTLVFKKSYILFHYHSTAN